MLIWKIILSMGWKRNTALRKPGRDIGNNIYCSFKRIQTDQMLVLVNPCLVLMQCRFCYYSLNVRVNFKLAYINKYIWDDWHVFTALITVCGIDFCVFVVLLVNVSLYCFLYCVLICHCHQEVFLCSLIVFMWWLVLCMEGPHVKHPLADE